MSRELGVPAVVGTGDATHVLEDDREVTISCAEGQTGYVYDGRLEYEEETVDITDLPDTETDVMLNMASPEGAFRWWRLPADGIGLARMEFIINNTIQIHPMALVRFDELEADTQKKRLRNAQRDTTIEPSILWIAWPKVLLRSPPRKIRNR